MKRTFSGVQPSGTLHIGNYLGAIKHFVELQDSYDGYYCVVDLHAITVPQNPEELKEQIEHVALFYLAAGLDHERVTLFVQSDVPCHAELGWIMQCFATFGELSRMTQFKEKSEGKETVSGGLFTYPALMAADILLYDTDYVPVGDDQKQHVELCRDIAQKINSRYGRVLKVPAPLIPNTGARIKSIQDPGKKMSKSDSNPYSYITLLDTDDEISKKIRRAVTDSGREVVYSPEEKPALANLLTIYSLCSGESVSTIQDKYEGKGYADLKKGLTETVIHCLSPMRDKYYEIKESGQLTSILREGAAKANEIASETLKRVKKSIGLSMYIDPGKRSLL